MKGTAMARRVRRLALFLLALIAAPAASAHYVDLNQALHSKNTLTVGIALTGQPFAYKRDGVVRGFEVEMAKAVAEAHGLALKVVRLPRAKLAAALAAGEVDTANTLALGEEPADIKTVPYLVVGDHLMVLRGNPFRIREADDLSGRVTSVTSGSTGEQFAHALNREFEEAGRKPMHVHSFPDERWTHFPVSMGHAQGYFIQTVSAVAVNADPDSRNRLVDGVFHPVREVGFAIRADNDKLHHASRARRCRHGRHRQVPPPAGVLRAAGRAFALQIGPTHPCSRGSSASLFDSASCPKRSTASRVSRTSSQVVVWLMIHILSANVPCSNVDDMNAGSSQNIRASTVLLTLVQGLPRRGKRPAGLTRKHTTPSVGVFMASRTELARTNSSALAASSIPLATARRNVAIPKVWIDIQTFSARTERLS